MPVVAVLLVMVVLVQVWCRGVTTPPPYVPPVGELDRVLARLATRSPRIAQDRRPSGPAPVGHPCCHVPAQVELVMRRRIHAESEAQSRALQMIGDEAIIVDLRDRLDRLAASPIAG